MRWSDSVIPFPGLDMTGPPFAGLNYGLSGFRTTRSRAPASCITLTPRRLVRVEPLATLRACQHQSALSAPPSRIVRTMSARPHALSMIAGACPGVRLNGKRRDPFGCAQGDNIAGACPDVRLSWV